MDVAMKKVMLNCGLSVCDNDSISMIEGCPNNELSELLKTKKHARIFVYMLKYFENENHILHNSISKSKSFIKKYKRKNRVLSEKVDNLKGNVNLTEAWKVKKKFCLKVKNVCLMQAYLCIPHWRCLIHANGILTVAVLVIWQEINHCLRHLKRRLVTMWLLVMEVMLKFSVKGLLRYQDYLYWKMSYTSKG